MVDANTELLETELSGAYGAMLHTSDGDPAFAATPQELEALMEQMPELATALSPEEAEELNEILAANNLEPDDLMMVLEMDELSPELREALEEALEQELAERELEEIDPEEIVIDGMSLRDWQAYAQGLQLESESFRIQANAEERIQLESEVEVDAQLQTADAKASEVPADIQAANAHYDQADQSHQRAFEANTSYHANNTLAGDRMAAATAAEDIHRAGVTSTPQTIKGPFGT